MLKAHQMCIDLEKNVLRIQGREVKFLAEHELPEKARAGYSVDEHGNPSRGLLPGSSTAGGAGGSTSASQSNPSPQFPGAGHTIGAPPATSTSPPPRGGASSGRGGGAGPAAHAQSRYPETSIATLMSLGASREDAIRLLDSTGGNVELAASAMF
jgi:DNA damage-inducible protein 1